MKLTFEKIKNYKYLKPAVITLALFAGVFIILFFVASAKNLAKREAAKKTQKPAFSTPTIKPLISPFPTSFEEIKKNPSILEGTSVLFPALHNNYIYYLSDAGSRFYKISIDGKGKLAISDVFVATIKNVIWSPNKTQAVLQVENNKYFLGKNNSPFFSQEDENMATTNWLYDFNEKSLRKLNTAAVAFSFSPSGKLYYISIEQPENAPPESVLYSLDPKTSISLKGLVFPKRQNVLSAISDSLALSSSEPDPFIRNIAYHLIDLTNNTASEIPSPGNIYGSLVSQSGKYVASQKVEKDKNLAGISLLDVEKKNFSDVVAYGDIRKSAWSKNEDTLFVISGEFLIKISLPDLKTSQYSLPAGVSSFSIDDGSFLVSENNRSFFFTFKNTLYNISF